MKFRTAGADSISCMRPGFGGETCLVSWQHGQSFCDRPGKAMQELGLEVWTPPDLRRSGPTGRMFGPGWAPCPPASTQLEQLSQCVAWCIGSPRALGALASGGATACNTSWSCGSPRYSCGRMRQGLNWITTPMVPPSNPGHPWGASASNIRPHLGSCRDRRAPHKQLYNRLL